MIKPKLKRIFLVLLFLFLVYSCVPDAIHDNPLDPVNSSSLNTVSLSGSVFTLYAPHTQLPDVTILLKEAGRIAKTNSVGVFKIDNINAGKYTLIISKENYQGDSLSVTIGSENNVEMEPVFLNAIPRLKSIAYYSEIKRTILSIDPLVSVLLEVSAIDFDGADDIDSLYAWIPGYSYKAVIDTNNADGLEIHQNDSLGFDLFNLAEKPLFIVLKDRAGFKTTAGPFFIHRFITVEPFTRSPGDLEVAIQPLFFVWEKQELPFSFTYELTIFRQRSNQREQVFKQTGIDPKTTNYNFNLILDSGFYFWQIAIRDSKNNSSESIESIFQIQ
jgi:carboxypeptidase-like protein